MSGKSGTDGKTVVELASFDYLVAMTVENYLLVSLRSELIFESIFYEIRIYKCF